MAKNILILTGSPRKSGNSNLMAEALANGARSKGHQVTIFNAASKTIKGCIDCKTCWQKRRACSFVDGFTELEPLLEQADVLVFVSPLYWFSFSSQIKAAIDKMNAYDSSNVQRPLHIQQGVLLTCAAGDDMKIFDGIIASYKSMLEFLGWSDAGILAVPGVPEKGDVRSTNALMEAEQLGSTL